MPKAFNRLVRRHEACIRAVDKLIALHYKHVTNWNVLCLGRRIMRIVRRIRNHSRWIHQEAMKNKCVTPVESMN